MPSATFALADATPEHFEQIVRIERASGGGSLVALTEGHALAEAIERGHYVTVALERGHVVGWIWYSVDAGRGGEEIGQVFRVAVAPAHRKRGAGAALLAHARDTLASRGCTRLRATVPADDAGARAFFERTGYAVDAVTMEHPL